MTVMYKLCVHVSVSLIVSVSQSAKSSILDFLDFDRYAIYPPRATTYLNVCYASIWQKQIPVIFLY